MADQDAKKDRCTEECTDPQTDTPPKALENCVDPDSGRSRPLGRWMGIEGDLGDPLPLAPRPHALSEVFSEPLAGLRLYHHS